MRILFIFLVLFISCKNDNKKKIPDTVATNEIVTTDCHVHIMSPMLINEWKSMGIPFSRPDYLYSDIDSILKRMDVDKIHLIGMGYVYGNRDYYAGEDSDARIREENNYLASQKAKHPNTVKAYYAVDPLRNNAMEEIKRCHDSLKMDGLKLHFGTSQVYLTEPEHLAKVFPVFEYASQNNIPVLLHFDNFHPRFGARDVAILTDSILKKIDSIHLTIAHFGSSGPFSEKTKNVISAFKKQFDKGAIPEKQKILFDISGVALDKESDGILPLAAEEYKVLKSYLDTLGIRRISFGTDYPLYTTEAYSDILKNKVGMTQGQIDSIMQNASQN